MIAHALRVEVERYAADRYARNVSFAKSAADFERAREWIIASEPYLAIARDRAREIGDPRLARFYERRLRERALPAPTTSDASAITLAATLARGALEAPVLYLAILLFADYAPLAIGRDDAGGAAIERTLDAIDEIVTDPRLLSPLRAALRDAMARFDTFCTETSITDASRVDSVGAVAQASAA